MKIPQYVPFYPPEARRAVADYALGDGWFSERSDGPCRQFERALASYCEREHCVLFPSGTVALEMACAYAFVPGSHVAVPALTHAATASAIVRAGCVPDFRDVDPVALGMSCPNTRSVLVTFNGRLPSPEAAITGRVRVHDAAQSLGSGNATSIGDAVCLSFSPPKVLSTGQGGAILTDYGDAAAELRQLRDFGRTRPGVDEWEWVGTNAKVSDALATLGLAQMATLPGRVAVKKWIYDQYRQRLEGTQGIALVPTDTRYVCPWFVDILVSDGRRNKLENGLAGAGIGTRPCYECLPTSQAFQEYTCEGQSWPVAERVCQELLWLPSSLTLTEAEIDYVCTEIRRIMA